MADESRVATGKRFSSHMRQIREERGISVDELHAETRIARSLIESFEQGGLYEHDTFNEVYLRSFVRAYAEAIEISPGAALDGLDEALAETYDDALADRYLHGATPDAYEEKEEDDLDSSSAEERARPPAAGGPEGRGGLVGPPRALGEEGPTMDEEEGQSVEEEEVPPSPEAESSETHPPAQPDEDSEETEPEAAPDPTSGSPSKASDSSEESEAEDTFSDDEDEVFSGAEDIGEEEEDLDARPSWMGDKTETDEDPVPPSASESPSPEPGQTEEPPSPPAGEVGGSGIVGEPTAMGEGASAPETQEPTGAPARPAASGRSSQSSLWTRLLKGEQQEILWASVGIAVVLLVMAGLGIAFFSSGDASTTESQSPATTVADTAASSNPDTTTSSNTRPPPANVTLGESIPLTILATGNVSGIRIRRDDDLRRPYWIGEGEAHVFPFEERATIENELGDIQLFLAGYPYPVSPQDTVGGIEITRSQVEAFTDTLRGAPAKLTVTPDTIPVGAPQQQ